jgi:anti-anti-sigma regulatory factor
VSGGQLVIRAERRGRICVVALSGPLDMAGSAGLTERVSAERGAGPARLVIDMSGVSTLMTCLPRITRTAISTSSC